MVVSMPTARRGAGAFVGGVLSHELLDAIPHAEGNVWAAQNIPVSRPMCLKPGSKSSLAARSCGG